MSLSELAGLLDARLSGGLTDFDPGRPLPAGFDFVAPGLNPAAGVSELAELMSGTSDRRSKAYKSARRKAERWQKGANRPSPRGLRELLFARRQQDDQLRIMRTKGADMRLLVGFFSDGPVGWIPPHRYIPIDAQLMRIVIRQWAEGDEELAAETLITEFLIVYRVPRSTIREWITDAEILDLELLPEARAR